MTNWTLYDLRLPRDQAKAAVQANATLKDTDKAYICALIDAQPEGCFAVSVNAYLQTHVLGKNTVCNLNVTVTGMQ